VGWLPVGNIQTVESGERRGLRLIYVRGLDGISPSASRGRAEIGNASRCRGSDAGVTRFRLMIILRLLVSVVVAFVSTAASAQNTGSKLPDYAKTPTELSALQPTGGAAGSGNPESR